MKKFWLLLMVLVSWPAQAAWTDEERIELRKIVATQLVAQSTFKTLARQMPAMVNPKEASEALHALASIGHSIGDALGCAAGTGYSCRLILDRTEQVQQMYSRFKAVNAHQARALSALTALGQTVLANQIRTLPIESFNRTLAYANPSPESLPNVVGPHGDYAKSQEALAFAVWYGSHTQHDIVRLWQNSNGNVQLISVALAESADVQAKLLRIWGLDSDVTLPDDEALIKADTAAGSGLRTAPFFRLLLEIEHAFGSTVVSPIFSGRNHKQGVTGDIDAMTINVTNYLGTLTASELARSFAIGSTLTFGAVGTNTWARHFYLDLGTFTRHLDIWGASVMLFFRPPPAPPAR